MGQLANPPYSILKQDKRAYEIMLLCDLYGNTYSAVAGEYSMSVSGITRIYRLLKRKQAMLYISCISAALGHENTLQIEAEYNDAYDCYQDLSYACGYFEKKYKDILAAYRCGEPGMPPQFLKSLPPFRRKLSKKTIARIVEMREAEKASFIEIGKKLHITREKARYTYDWFYHEKTLAFNKAMHKKAESNEEKIAIFKNCFNNNLSAKKRYDKVLRDIGEIT